MTDAEEYLSTRTTISAYSGVARCARFITILSLIPAKHSAQNAYRHVGHKWLPPTQSPARPYFTAGGQPVVKFSATHYLAPLVSSVPATRRLVTLRLAQRPAPLAS
jgi:hypothetical protein